MLTVNSSENYLAAGIAGLGIIPDPAHCRARSPAAGRLIEVLLATVPSRCPFHWFIRSVGSFPGVKPVYAVAGWRNERALD